MEILNMQQPAYSVFGGKKLIQASNKLYTYNYVVSI